MEINSKLVNYTSNSTTSALTSTNKTATTKVDTAATKTEDAAAVYTPSKESDTSTKKTSGSKTKAAADPAEVERLLEATKQQNANFQSMIASLVSKQAGSAKTAIDFDNGTNLAAKIAALKVDPETAAKAKADVAEDGYYGVKNTTDRILSFATAVAGDDPKKLASMRKAVEAGFKAAESAWGDKMPDITKQTYDAVMSGFDKLQGKDSATA